MFNLSKFNKANIKHLFNSAKKTIRKKFFQYESKFILIISFILVFIFSFEIGYLKNREVSQNPLVIEKPSECLAVKNTSENKKNTEDNNNSVSSYNNRLNKNKLSTNKKCLYIGSRNSHFYHLSTSSYAKRIKPENLICFSSKDEATLKKYVPDKSLASKK